MNIVRTLLLATLLSTATCAPLDRTLAEQVEAQLATLDDRGRLAQLIVAAPRQPLTLDGGRVAVGGAFHAEGAVLTTPVTPTEDSLLRPMVVATLRPPGPPAQSGGPRWPGPALASGTPGDLRELGRRIGQGARANRVELGIMSLSSDQLAHLPRGVREPTELAERVTALLSGVTERGPLVALELFAGSESAGDTLPWDLARLEALDGLIVSAATGAGVAAMIPAPVRLPALTGDTVPLPHSSAAMAFLRRDHGWDGVVAVNLAADSPLLRDRSPGEAAVAALNAGADLLLAPSSPQLLLEELAAAMADGRLPAQRVDQATRRVLRLKLEAQRRAPPEGGRVAPAAVPVPAASPAGGGAAPASLARATAAEAGMDDARLRVAEVAIERALGEELFTAAALGVVRRGRIVKLRGFGREPGGGEVTGDGTIFDLASLTKVVATTSAVALLAESGELTLDTPVRSLLPAFQGEHKERVTIRHLLAHTSGMPPGLWLYGSARSSGMAMDQVLRQSLRHPPEQTAEYSDLGMILLARAAEVAAGESLDRFLARNLFAPLGMSSTMFLPPAAMHERVVPTALRNERGFVLHGVVHDGNAFRLGGVAGHAGLFSTARDLLIFGQMMLQGGEYGGIRILEPETVATFVRRQPAAGTRALGWDTPADRSSAGRLMSARSFGHTGYTGTSLWIDPELELVVVLLTNRTYDSGSPARILALRQAVHEAVAGAVDDRPVVRRAGAR